MNKSELIFPVDVLVEILSFLECKDLYNTFRVSKRWNEVTNHDQIWYKLFQRKFANGTIDKPDATNWKWFYKSIAETSFVIMYTNYFSNTQRGRLLRDVTDKLNAKLYKRIDTIDVTQSSSSYEKKKKTSVPTLDELEKYSAVLCYSHNSFYENPALVGDLLADYVDRQGGVVIMAYACCGCYLEGRWHKDGYDPLTPQQSGTGKDLTLVNVNNPNHPIMKGITSFSSVKSHYMLYSPGNPSNKSEVIATMFDQHTNKEIPLVVEKSLPNKGKVVTLNFLPCSSDVYEAGWNSTTQGAQLIINALRYVAARRL